jgi:uncharacterized protein (DUF488 family)
MTNTAYAIGYSGRTPEGIKAIVEELDAYLVDIRFVPFSRNPGFRKKALESLLGSRYVHLKILGNRNYKGGPLELVNYEGGRAALEVLDKPALLMCMCKDAGTCHRTIVLEKLAQDGFETQEWGAPQQLTLW